MRYDGLTDTDRRTLNHFRVTRAIATAIARVRRRADDCAACAAGLDQQARRTARALFDAHNANCDNPRCLGF